MVTIRDSDELSRCLLKTASGGQQAQAVLGVPAARALATILLIFIILICIFPSESLGEPN